MAGLRCTDRHRPRECWDCTRVPLDEFPPLVPSFEAAFHAHLAAWRLAGTPRPARPLAVSKYRAQ
jgi:hypothetical protein